MTWRSFSLDRRLVRPLPWISWCFLMHAQVPADAFQVDDGGQTGCLFVWVSTSSGRNTCIILTVSRLTIEFLALLMSLFDNFLYVAFSYNKNVVPSGARFLAIAYLS